MITLTSIHEFNPVAIRPEQIRSFTPRRHGNPGTRISFLNGRGIAVTEDFDAVAALLGAPVPTADAD